jgi:hypothetical protein
MRIDEYTPEAVCRAMGLGGFAGDPERGHCGETIRLLLEPAFNPEVCVTLSVAGSESVADLRTFGSQFWHMPGPGDPPPVYAETITLGQSELDRIVADFQRIAPAVPGEASKWVVAGGMFAFVVHRSGEATREFGANVGASRSLRRFVADVLKVMHLALPRGRCRNAVAEAAKYADMNLPLDSLPALSAATRVIVLGDREGKQAIVERLIRHNTTRSNLPPDNT